MHWLKHHNEYLLLPGRSNAPRMNLNHMNAMHGVSNYRELDSLCNIFLGLVKGVPHYIPVQGSSYCFPLQLILWLSQATLPLFSHSLSLCTPTLHLHSDSGSLSLHTHTLSLHTLSPCTPTLPLLSHYLSLHTHTPFPFKLRLPIPSLSHSLSLSLSL